MIKNHNLVIVFDKKSFILNNSLFVTYNNLLPTYNNSINIVNILYKYRFLYKKLYFI